MAIDMAGFYPPMISIGYRTAAGWENFIPRRPIYMIEIEGTSWHQLVMAGFEHLMVDWLSLLNGNSMGILPFSDTSIMFVGIGWWLTPLKPCSETKKTQLFSAPGTARTICLKKVRASTVKSCHHRTGDFRGDFMGLSGELMRYTPIKWDINGDIMGIFMEW